MAPAFVHPRSEQAVSVDAAAPSVSSGLNRNAVVIGGTPRRRSS
jgi:hypothetical protein